MVMPREEQDWGNHALSHCHHPWIWFSAADQYLRAIFIFEATISLILGYNAITSPTTPQSPARSRFWPAPATAPLVAVEFEAEVDVADEVEVPVADEALPVIEAEAPVSEGTEAAVPVGSAVPEVPEEPVAVALPPDRIFSRPAVIVTGNRLSVRPLTTVLIVPGSLASGPAIVWIQSATSDVILQSASIVLRLVSHCALLVSSTW